MKTRIMRGGEVLGEFDLDPGEYLVGSGDSAHLRLEKPSVAPRHARLKIGTGGVEVEDLGSGLGTVLGELAVSGVQPVPSGSLIQVGDLVLQIWEDASVESVWEPGAAAAPAGEPEGEEDRYVVGDVVAQGAMGVIRRAREVATGREVAMKQMHEQLEAGDPALAARFLQEAKITAHLEHPNVVPVHDVSPGQGGSRFYTMKMVRGVSLEEILGLLTAQSDGAAEKYSLEALLTIFQKVCDALAFAHSKDVIHRDLKPANIMVGDYGEVLVMDWGVAKLLSETGEGILHGIESAGADGHDSFATMAGTVMGTPYYMAPEQASGEVRFIDARSDVYALGAILYELLTLQTSVEGRSGKEVLKNVRDGKLIPPLQRVGAKLLPHLPGGRLPASLAAVAMKAMAFSPERRYQRAPDLQADVRAFQDGHATGAEDASVWRQFALLVMRHKAVSAAIAASLTLLAVLSAFYTAGVIRERNRANAERDRARQGLALVSIEKASVTVALADVEPQRLRADAERARAEAETKNTKAALAKLRTTASTFLAEAETLVENQNAPQALEKLDFAIAVDPGNPAYLLRRAHLLEATLQLKDAAAAYRQALALRADASATTNLALCERLLKDSPDPAKLPQQDLQYLYQAVVAQNRQMDSLLLARLIGRADIPVDALFAARLKSWQSLSGWKTLAERFGLRDGGYFLNLSGLPITDLSPLLDLPIQSLDISGTKVMDLTPLGKLPLKTLNLDNTLVTNLSPLHGLPLTSISMWETAIADISPLKGASLKFLKIGRSIFPSPLRDLSPLKGMPLSYVSIKGAAVFDLSPIDNPNLTTLEFGHTTVPPGVQTLDALKTAPLSERLDADMAFTLNNIDALRGKPLTVAIFSRCDRLRDLSPLAACPTLTELTLPGNIASATGGAVSLESLRKLPKLQRVGYGGLMSAADFWNNYDRRKRN